MHPALSVIVFTTASGAGYGLLALLGIFSATAALPESPLFGAIASGLALALVTAGLLASTLHLGHPERAWRAFSEWRSSWLSREGVAAVLTYVPAVLFAGGWMLTGGRSSWIVVAGLAAALGAAATVAATGMIYASLKPVTPWHGPFTLPGYLLFALMTGAALLNAVLHLFGAPDLTVLVVAGAATLAGWAFKTIAWRHGDAARMPADAASAVGLPPGTVRSVEWPHTEENYLLKEMGYRVARRHAARLRRLVHLSAFLVPAVLLALALAAGGPLAAVASVAAVAAQGLGMLAERWLFFAEARHTVTLYYGR
jgi:DMSO reductase anchor subunit